MNRMRPIDNPRHFALMLCQERIDQGFLQAEVACAAGTKQSVISDVERGGRDTSLALALRVAAALGFRLALVPFSESDVAAVEEIVSIEGGDAE